MPHFPNVTIGEITCPPRAGPDHGITARRGGRTTAQLVGETSLPCCYANRIDGVLPEGRAPLRTSGARSGAND